jgi:hypothetical protein
VIADCWHTQLRVVARYFPAMQLRAHKNTVTMKHPEGVFVHVTEAVQFRGTECPPDVARIAAERGYIIIHVQEPRE